MTVNKLFRTTDHPQRVEPLRVCTNAEEARIAALGSITSTCGDCGKSWRGHNIPEHSCRDFRGNDLGPAKRARAEAARQQLAALRHFAPAPPCRHCSAEMPSGQWHECADAAKALPHEVAAAAWQRQGAATLAAELAEVQEGSTS